MAPPGAGKHRIEPEPGRNLVEQRRIGLEVVELLEGDAADCRIGVEQRTARILREAAEGRQRQLHAAEVVRALQARDDAKALGVALEAQQVLLLGGMHAPDQRTPERRFLEELADAVLAGMAERRIAEIVRERGRRDDRPEIGRHDLRQPVARDHDLADPVAERARDAGHLQRMRQARAHVIVRRQRKDLRLVLHAPERRGKHDAVEVALEVGALRVLGRGSVADAEAATTEELVPVHRRELSGDRGTAQRSAPGRSLQ